MQSKKKYDKKIELSYSDYKRVRKTTFPLYLKKALIVLGIFLVLALIDGIFEKETPKHSIIVTILGGGLVLSYLIYIIILIINKLLLKTKYNKLNKSLNISFNDEYLIIDKDIYGYKSINNFFENDYLLYFYVDKEMLVFFDKEKEDEKLIDYIRLKITKEKGYIDSKIKYKKHLIILNILFVLSILSLFFINVIPTIVAKSQLPETLIKIYPNVTIEIFNVFKNTIESNLIFDYYEWSLLLIIFPTALYILALRLKRIGINCKLSIVCAIITGSIITFVSMGYENYKTRIDYKTFSKYKNILNIEIPKNGMYFMVNEDEDMLLSAYYKDENDAKKILEEIKNNNNWGTIYNLDIELHDYLTENGNNDDCYYSIYDETTNTYDVPLRKKGKHVIYSMSYNYKNNILMIFKFEEYV